MCCKQNTTQPSFPFFLFFTKYRIDPPPYDNMLSYDIAVPFLMASFVMTSSAITTTSGENNDPRLVRKIKNSKKQGYNNLPGPCLPAGGTFNGISKDAFFRTHQPYNTCFQFNDDVTYCWTKSYYQPDIDGSQWTYATCAPDGDAWHYISAEYVKPVTQPNSCGKPCQNQHRT